MVGRLLAVTGATGSIGSRFTQEAIARGYSLRLLGRTPAELPGASWGRFDLEDLEPVDPGSFAGAETVVHLAAYVPREQRDDAEAEPCFRSNALGTLRLLRAARGAGVKRFIHVVSANAYTPGLSCPDEDAQMLPTRRGTFYLMSKVAQEAFGAFYANQPGFSVTALRVSSVYDTGKTTGLIPSFLRALLSSEPIQLNNGGRYGTDWVNVEDVVKALFFAVEGAAVGAFNVGSGVRVTMAELVELMVAIVGSRGPGVEILPADDPLDIGFPALDIGRLRLVGYAPTQLSEALPRYLETLRSSANGIDGRAGS